MCDSAQCRYSHQCTAQYHASGNSVTAPTAVCSNTLHCTAEWKGTNVIASPVTASNSSMAMLNFASHDSQPTPLRRAVFKSFLPAAPFRLSSFIGIPNMKRCQSGHGAQSKSDGAKHVDAGQDPAVICGRLGRNGASGGPTTLSQWQNLYQRLECFLKPLWISPKP